MSWYYCRACEDDDKDPWWWLKTDMSTSIKISPNMYRVGYKEVPDEKQPLYHDEDHLLSCFEHDEYCDKCGHWCHDCMECFVHENYDRVPISIDCCCCGTENDYNER